METKNEQIRWKEVSEVYFGYLVGRIRQVVEASITDKKQLDAVISLMNGRFYDWWDDADNDRGTLQGQVGYGRSAYTDSISVSPTAKCEESVK